MSNGHLNIPITRFKMRLAQVGADWSGMGKISTHLDKWSDMYKICIHIKCYDIKCFKLEFWAFSYKINGLQNKYDLI